MARSPAPSSSDSPAFLDQYQARICLDLARTGMQGIWAHCAGTAVMLLAARTKPALFTRLLGPGLAIALLALCRGAITRRRTILPDRIWLQLYCATLTLTSLLWGSVLALLLLTEGQKSDVSILVMLMMTGVAAGALGGLSASRSLQVAYPTAMWLPPLVAGLVPGRHGPLYFLATIFALFLIYLVIQGANFHREYVAGLRREADLDAARRAAEDASHAKSSFVANISHEIRTPMNGVLGMLELTLLDDLPDRHRETLEIARSSAQSLLGLLNDVLDFSKIGAGRMELESVPLRVTELVADVARLFRAEADAKGILVVASAPAALPPLLGDPTRLRQVLVNLVGNAVKFTAAGEVAVEVTELGTAPHHLRFAVRDTGIGIPPAKQAVIFEAFAQADGDTTRKYGGTGLGLAISRNLVLLMGGQLSLASTPGEGSTFSFELTMAAAPTAAPTGTAAPVVLPSLRILVAEDNAINQRVARGLLTRQGHKVEIAPNGLAAVDACLAGKFDLVLMDVQMPQMGGHDATRLIRQRQTANRTPIIGLTANASAADRRLCLEAGMDEYVAKPLQIAVLCAAIARVLPATCPPEPAAAVKAPVSPAP